MAEHNNLGKIGEQFAQQEYRKRGFKIIAANEFNRVGKQAGEIDFIAINDKAIVFVEVKTRASLESAHGTAAEAVSYYKQIKILKAVKLFMLRHSAYQSLQPSIDVCALIVSPVDKIVKNVTIISNAVEDTN